MAHGKMNCEKCGKNISMSGTQVCEICDPDILKIINKEVKSKSLNLCDKCFGEHIKSHDEIGEKIFTISGNKMLKIQILMREHNKLHFCRPETDFAGISRHYTYMFLPSELNYKIEIVCDCGDNIYSSV